MALLEVAQQHRGFRILQRTKAIPCYCKESDHRWTIPVAVKGVTIDCDDSMPGLIYTREHGSIKAAIEHIDYILKFPFYAFTTEQLYESRRAFTKN